MQAFLPEWEIQEILASNPKLLEIPGKFEGIKIRAQQKYLPKTGGYIDLLCKSRVPSGWLVVEIKATPINDSGPGLQVLQYKQGLAVELRAPPEEIHCMVAAPGSLPVEVEGWYASSGVAIRRLDVAELTGHRFAHTQRARIDADDDVTQNLVSRRTASLELTPSDSSVSVESVRRWIDKGIHDSVSLSQLSSIIRWLSASAPLFAHDVRLPSSRLDDFERQWFWLFYSAIDRRGNAALFVRGKERLERSGLFMPDAIVKLASENGEGRALEVISHELTRAEVPPVIDLRFGRRSLAKSIVDAASLISKYGNDFGEMLAEWESMASGPDVALFVMRKVQKSIYGVGPRSAAQFVRGMVLKGPWDLLLTSGVFLENTKYNAMFAGPARLSIAKDDFLREAAQFADDYLDGDKGILSHALWYIRKRYCDKVPLCPECPVAGYCAYYRHSEIHGRPRRRSRSGPRQSRVEQLRLMEFGSQTSKN